jgi:hypothetical protein
MRGLRAGRRDAMPCDAPRDAWQVGRWDCHARRGPFFPFDGPTKVMRRKLWHANLGPNGRSVEKN